MCIYIYTYVYPFFESDAVFLECLFCAAFSCLAILRIEGCLNSTLWQYSWNPQGHPQGRGALPAPPGAGRDEDTSPQTKILSLTKVALSEYGGVSRETFCLVQPSLSRKI